MNFTLMSALCLALVASTSAFANLQVKECWQGFSQREQDANLAACRASEGANQICVSSMWVHEQAAYDVALMDSPAAESPKAPTAEVAAPEPATPEAQPSAAPQPAPAARAATELTARNAPFLSNGSRCYRVDKDGSLYGSRVADPNCHASYRSNGRGCYNVDHDNKIYGTWVRDELCSR